MSRPLLLVPLLALALVAPAEAQDDRALLERALELGDRAPSELHYRIAAPRNAEAFARLKEALAPLRDPGTLRAGYGACAVFRGAAIEVSVRNWLARQAFHAGSAAEQVAAVEALAYYWRDAENELLRVVRGHSLRECRELALEPLLPRLVAAGDRDSCRLVLRNLSTRGWQRSALLGAIERFRDLESEAAMASVLRSPSTPSELKLLLLGAFGERESRIARAAVDGRLEDPDDRVRLDALRLVAARRDPADHERLESLALGGGPDFALEAMLAIAEARSGDEEFLLELYAHTQSRTGVARRAAAAALARIPTRDALALLHRLLRDEELEVRLEAIEGLQRLRQLESVPRLITAMGGPRELLTHRAARALRWITGEDHGVSRDRWQAWFEREGGGFQPPTLEEARRREEERIARRDPGSGGTSASFYGLPVEGTRVCFVLDTSGSMDELASGRGTTAGRRTTRLEVARKEVAASLDQLLDGVRFNLITFASDVRALAPELVELGPRSRAKAREAAESWRAAGGTALFDGLQRALLDPDIEEVFLLTDGVPTEGAVVEEDDILARVQELVGGREVKVHGVAIGQRSGLLRRLARATGGHYAEIR